MTPNKVYITNEDGEMVEVYGDIKIDSTDNITYDIKNDGHLIYRFNPEQQLTITANDIGIHPMSTINKYDEKIDALEKRITKLENNNNDEFNMRRIL